MKEFGWTIEYVLSLTYPVFFNLFGLIRRVRLDSAIDEFYTPYAAAKYGSKCSKILFEGRGKITFSNTDNSKSEKITPYMVKKARKKLHEIIRQQQEALAQNAGISGVDQ